jgi:hypothetical protein
MNSLAATHLTRYLPGNSRGPCRSVALLLMILSQSSPQVCAQTTEPFDEKDFTVSYSYAAVMGTGT